MWTPCLEHGNTSDAMSVAREQRFETAPPFNDLVTRARPPSCTREGRTRDRLPFHEIIERSQRLLASALEKFFRMPCATPTLLELWQANIAAPEYPVNDEFAPSGSELATSTTIRLADLEVVEAGSMGEAVRPSSLREGVGSRACCSPHLVSIWNKLLWDTRLELRYTVRQGLTLASIAAGSHTKVQTLGATALVHDLLTTHPCLTALDIDTEGLKGYEGRFLDALRGNRSIRFLKITFNTLAFSKDICSTITTLVNLEEVECLKACGCPMPFCAALAKLLQSSTKLRALRIPKLRMSGAEASVFLPALAGNTILEELSFHSSTISEARPEHRALFAKFLAGATALKKLSVSAYYELRKLSLKWVLMGLLRNTALVDVTLDDFVVDADSGDIMAEILTRNRALRVLNVSVVTYDAWMTRLGDTGSDHVARENLGIRTVGGPFFEPLCKNEALEDGAKGRVQRSYLLGKTVRCTPTLRDGGARLFDTNLNISVKEEILECKGFSEFSAFVYRDEQGRVSRILRRLPSLTHLTTAHLEIFKPYADEALSADIALYIATTSALKELHLWMRLRHRFPVAGDVNIDMGLALILESLCHNTSINELHVFPRFISGPETELLADTLKSSRTIRRAPRENPRLRSGIDGIEHNRNLLCASMDDCNISQCEVDQEWFAIWDATRRNSDLVARAAQFVSGTVFDRYGAEALERIAEYPSLLQEVAQLLSLSDAEVTALARARLKSMQSLDGFMRAAGIVKDCVSCYRHVHGDMQLEDLNEDCWSLVRRYLKVRDVRDSVAAATTDDLRSRVTARMRAADTPCKMRLP
ncbi:hypothetical protein HPB50_010087 [Hyalomma asiaticum]|uniref:Uncharacterized protein n=1 Tax=Hyalomma asiaticum TaxID=266040 RepID=A0ACB7T9F8_HYAAI|nr:hypothetical protein HPB50_010087 [Hyalomma asiaticum]